jgi:hypothetical protein
MPVLPHASLSQFRPSCGSGSGLRGVLPKAASWSKGTRRCAGDAPTLTLMQGYIPAGFMDGSGEQLFEKVADYTELSDRTEPHIVVRTWSALGITAAPDAALDDDIGDVPVLLVPIPDGQTSGDMPASATVDLNTPVIGRFSEDVAHTAEFGVSTYLLDPAASVVDTDLQSVCITQKAPMFIDCPGIGGYYEDGISTPAILWCFGSIASFADGLNRFKQIEPDLYHMDYRLTGRVSDFAYLPLFPSGAALASGDYVITAASLNQNNPIVGTVAGLGDTACP